MICFPSYNATCSVGLQKYTILFSMNDAAIIRPTRLVSVSIPGHEKDPNASCMMMIIIVDNDSNCQLMNGLKERINY